MQSTIRYKCTTIRRVNGGWIWIDRERREHHSWEPSLMPFRTVEAAKLDVDRWTAR